MLRFLSLLFLVVLGCLGFAYYDYSSTLKKTIDVPDAQRVFTIERGWSAKRVGEELASKGLVDKPHWFYLYSRLSKQSSGIKSGEFVIEGSPTIPELQTLFVKGQTKQYTASIIEGVAFRQLKAQLFDNKELVQPTEELSNEELMEVLGLAGLHPEGQFFADTYQFPKGSTVIEFLKRANAQLQTVLEEEWQNREPDLPLKTPYEAVILASIVEKETAVAEERPHIAGVFFSRLKIGMRLQTDPTVIYGMGEQYDGNIRRSDLTTDTPYNTYTRAGLPPTPIAMVGREAIHAVLHPMSTKDLYFVARGDGTHQFSETVEQHNAAVRKYQLKR